MGKGHIGDFFFEDYLNPCAISINKLQHTDYIDIISIQQLTHY